MLSKGYITTFIAFFKDVSNSITFSAFKIEKNKCCLMDAEIVQTLFNIPRKSQLNVFVDSKVVCHLFQFDV